MIPAPIFLGFSTGLSLIIAIGAQNAFLLRQGIRREHVLLTVIICAVSDIVLILAGVMGIGALVEHAPWILTFARIGGFIFLFCYAIFALKRAVSPQHPEHFKFCGTNRWMDGCIDRPIFDLAQSACIRRYGYFARFRRYHAARW